MVDRILVKEIRYYKDREDEVMKKKESPHVSEGWLQQIYNKYKEKRSSTEGILKTIERLVEIADPKIRQAGGYRKKLQSPVSVAQEYCYTFLDQIPGPVELTRQRYSTDPLVKSMFTSPDNLEEVLKTNPELVKIKKHGNAGKFVGLMTMHKDESTVYGYQREGEQVLKDVAQMAVNFSDHRLVGLSSNFDSTKAGIVERGLDVLATLAMEEIAGLNSQKLEYQQQKEYLKAAMKIMTGKARVFDAFGSPGPGKYEEYRKAEAKITEIEAALEVLARKIGMPDQSLSHLEQILNTPEHYLKIEQQEMRLNWMNIRVDKKTDEEGSEVCFAEFTLNDELKRSAVLVTLPVA